MNGQGGSGSGMNGSGMNGSGMNGSGACDRSLPCMGDLVLTLLAGTLSALQDRLAHDGFADHAEVVADLVDVVDDYMAHAVWGVDAEPEQTF
jgi:hypothetical protein